LRYEKEYFEKTNYSQRGQLIMKHVAEVLRWGSKPSHINLLDGHGKTALDVGCAYGYGVTVLEMLGYDSCGVDISEYSVSQAKKANPDVDFAVCDAQVGLPFDVNAFDVVTCFEVLEHLSNPLRAIRNMLGSCRQVMIFTTPNRAVEKPVKKIVRDFDRTHVSGRTPQEWKSDLSKIAQISEVRVESFLDSNLRVSNKLLFFKSFKIPYLGLDTRILIRKMAEAKL
jgi:2-polyprenyl-3-methyl-5-hydroxy-6-metoxy-1,4-benzoquinol methylase